MHFLHYYVSPFTHTFALPSFVFYNSLLSHFICPWIDRSRSNRMGVGWGSQKLWGCIPWDGAWLTVEICRTASLSRVCHMFAIHAHSRSYGTSLIMEIPRKNLTPCVLPFKVTQGHCNWHMSISYLWLPISDS